VKLSLKHIAKFSAVANRWQGTSENRVLTFAHQIPFSFPARNELPSA